MASLRSPSHKVRSSSADPHPPLHSMVYFQGCSIVHRPTLSGYSWSCQVPRVPLHDQGVTPLAMVSWTTSAGVTPPSSLLRTHAPVLSPPTASGFNLVRWVFAGCRQSLLGVGPSRPYLCESFPGCLDPYPGSPYGALARFFPQSIGLPPVRIGSAACFLRTATSVRA